MACADILAQGDSIKSGRNIDEVIVTGSRQPVLQRNIPVMVSVIDNSTLKAAHSSSVMPTVMEQVPGLFVTSRAMMGYGVSNGGSGGMMMRGISSAAGQMLVLIDGHPQYNGIYGHSISDSYQTLMTDHIEVMRGPASLLYGSNAMGGVMNIVTRKMKHDGMQTDINVGAGSYGTVDAEVSSSMRYGRFSGTVAGQYGRSDNHRADMGFEQYGGYMNLNYDMASHWKVFANADVTHFAASNPGTEERPMKEADQWITRGVVSAGIDNRYERTNGSLSFYNNFGIHKINDGYAAQGGRPQTRLFRSKDALMGVNFYQNIVPWKGGNITFGIDYSHIYGRAYYTDRTTGAVLQTQNKQSAHVHNNEIAAYTDIRQEITAGISLEAGVRYDNHSVTGGEWIPQGGVVIATNADGQLKAMVGRGFRNPTMREMYMYPPSNEDLKPERMTNYELSWRQKLCGGRLTYGANIFYLKADNIIQTVNRKNINTGKLENSGVEADMKVTILRNLSINTNHSYLHQASPVAGAPTYKCYLGVTWNKGRWRIGGGLTQVSGLYIEAGDDSPLENFTLMSLSVDYTPVKNMAIWLKGDNLLGQRYETYAGYPMPKATFMSGISIHI